MADPARPKVFGVGFAKSGTSSLGHFLRELGYRHRSGPQKYGLTLWQLGDLRRIHEIWEKFDSFDDWPHPYLYKEAAERYPDAKFVLTRRRDSATWLRSIVRHQARLGPSDSMYQALGVYDTRGREDELVARYEAHNTAVRDYFSGTDRLHEICWEEVADTSDICRFLGWSGPMPKVPWANATDVKSYRKFIVKLLNADRPGAAIAYAKSLDDPEPELAFLRREVPRRREARRAAIRAERQRGS